MEPYKGKKFQQRSQDNEKKSKNNQKQASCPDGYLCERLQILNGKCKYKHSEEDTKKSDQLQKLRKQKRTIAIFEKNNPNDLPIGVCIFYEDLPVLIVQPQQQQMKEIQTQTQDQMLRQNQKKIKKQQKEKQWTYKLGWYYQVEYVGINKQLRMAQLRILKQLCKFGQIDKEIQFMKQYTYPYFQYLKPGNNIQILKGTVESNWQRKKVLKCQKGMHTRYYFKNQQKDYQLTQGCTIKYSDGKTKYDKIKVYGVEHHPFKFTGIVQVDKNGIFYVKCRNWKHQNLDISLIPEGLVKKVKQMQQLMPYCIFKTKKLANNEKAKINQQLKKYLLKGHFNCWPQQTNNPLGVLQQQFNLLTLKSLKEAVIYQYLINTSKNSPTQRRESQKLISKIKKEKLAEKQDAIKQYVFTLDGIGTSCHDDALSVKLNNQKQQQFYEVGVHISDVDEYVSVETKINQQIKIKDKTTYVKGFYKPMFESSLMRYFSLGKESNKLTYSLFFKIDKKGLIDFNSIQFKQTCVKVSQNYFHEPKLRQLSELSNFFKLSDIVKNSIVLKQNIVGIEEQQQTQGTISILMLLSAMIPTFMVKLNIKRIQNRKIKIGEVIDRVIAKVSKLVNELQTILKKYKGVQKQINSVLALTNLIRKKIEKQVNQEMKKYRQQLRQQKKKIKAEKAKKKQKNQKQKVQGQEQSGEDEEEDEKQSQIQQKTVLTQLDLIQQQRTLKQQEQQIQHEKKIKQMGNKKIQLTKLVKKKQDEQISQSLSSQSQADQNQDNRKVRAAEGALKYLTKVFAILKVNIKWQSKEQIRQKFREARKFNNSQLFQQFMKRLYIINHQHFNIISRITKNNNKNNNKIEENPRKVQGRQIKYGPKNTQSKKDETKRPTQNQKQKKELGDPQNKLKQNEKKVRYIKKSEAVSKKQQQKEASASNLKLESPQTVQKQDKKQQNRKQQGQKINKVQKLGTEKQKQVQAKQKQKQQVEAKEEQKQQVKTSLKVKQKQKQKNKDQAYITRQQIQEMIQKYVEYYKIKQRKYLNKVKQTYALKQKQQKQLKQQKQEKVEDTKQKGISEKQQKARRRQTRNKLQQKLSKLNMGKYINEALLFQLIDSQTIKQEQVYQQLVVQQSQLKDMQVEQVDKQFYMNKKINMIKEKIMKQLKINRKFIQKCVEEDCKRILKSQKDGKNNIKQQNNQHQGNQNNQQNLEQKKYQKMQNKPKQQQIKLQIKEGQVDLNSQQNTDQTQDMKFEKIYNRKVQKMRKFLYKYKKPLKLCSKTQLLFYLQLKQSTLLVKYLQQQPQLSYKTAIPKSNNQKQQGNRQTKVQKKQRGRNTRRQDKKQKNLQIKEKEQNKTDENKQQQQKISKNENLNALQQGKIIQINSKSVQQITNSKLQETNSQTNSKIEQKQNIEKQQNKQQVNKINADIVQECKQSENVQQIKKQKNKKEKQKSKKQLQKQKLSQIRNDKNEKYKAQLDEKDQQIKKHRQKLQENKKELKQSLSGIDKQYNVLQYMVQKLKKNMKSKSKKKGKQSKKKNQKQEDKDKSKSKDQKLNKDKQSQDEQQEQQQYKNIQKLCNLIMDYSKKAQHKFSLMPSKQIEAYLKQCISEVGYNQELNMEQLNKEMGKLSKDEQMLLKWNNPIRSYQALETLRLIKDYQWLFNGQISPLDILLDYKAIKQLKKRIQGIRNERIAKMENEQMDKKHKQANRQINKIQFFYKIKNQQDKVHRLLNVTSPNEKCAKFVYHPTLGEIEVDNFEFEQEMFREVQGKFKIVSDFPMQVKAVLIK